MVDTLGQGAIELPTARLSRNFDHQSLDIHDPNYIPLLNSEASQHVGYSTPSFFGLPSLPSLRKDDVHTTLQRSNSSSAPETVIQFRSSVVLPSRRPTGSKNGVPLEIGSSQTNIKKEEVLSGRPSLSASEPSVVCTSSSLEEHVYTVTGNTTPKIDELSYPSHPQSARSSMSSTKRAVPTSRYNKHSMPAIPPSAWTSLPGMSSTPLMSQAEDVEPVPLLALSHESLFSTPIPPSPKETTPKLLPMKSTASERRARALHSHPSNISVQSVSSNKISDVDETSHRNDRDSRSLMSRPKSSRSIVHSRQPSPAPTAPLPDLPPQARRMPDYERTTERRQERATTPTTIHSNRAPTAQSQYTDLPSSMTSKTSTLFRRFDDVHVRLLLHLQEEIATLEKQLLELEKNHNPKEDNAMEKVKVMQELRKAVAEYDSLFATWNAMQANKASDATSEQLNEWRQHSANSDLTSQSAKDDLSWLRPSNNISTASITLEKHSSSTRLATSKPGQESSVSTAGGFLAWFGCASKRK